MEENPWQGGQPARKMERLSPEQLLYLRRGPHCECRPSNTLVFGMIQFVSGDRIRVACRRRPITLNSGAPQSLRQSARIRKKRSMGEISVHSCTAGGFLWFGGVAGTCWRRRWPHRWCLKLPQSVPALPALLERREAGCLRRSGCDRRPELRGAALEIVEKFFSEYPSCVPDSPGTPMAAHRGQNVLDDRP